MRWLARDLLLDICTETGKSSNNIIKFGTWRRFKSARKPTSSHPTGLPEYQFNSSWPKKPVPAKIANIALAETAMIFIALGAANQLLANANLDLVG